MGLFTSRERKDLEQVLINFIADFVVAGRADDRLLADVRAHAARVRAREGTRGVDRARRSAENDVVVMEARATRPDLVGLWQGLLAEVLNGPR